MVSSLLLWGWYYTCAMSCCRSPEVPLCVPSSQRLIPFCSYEIGCCSKHPQQAGQQGFSTQLGWSGGYRIIDSFSIPKKAKPHLVNLPFSPSWSASPLLWLSWEHHFQMSLDHPEKGKEKISTSLHVTAVDEKWKYPHFSHIWIDKSTKIF